VKIWDVVVSGAGIIGVSLALELRERGAQVLVLDRAEPGKEASSAAAGMLAVHDPETHEQLRPFAGKSAAMYPEFVRKLEQSSGMDVDFRYGAVVLLNGSEVLPEHKCLSKEDLKNLEPSLKANWHSAFFVAEETSVDPNLLMQAALKTAQNKGIEVRAHTAVEQMRSAGTQVEVIAGHDRFLAKSAVNCQGAWAGAPVRPRKGQMLYLQPQNPGLLQHVVRAPEVYLVPRSSGRILVGATVEDVGYDKSIDPQVVRQLHEAAAEIVPDLSSAEVVASWAGLRPGSPDDLPILGASESPGIFIASGHFRNGILLAPITAKIMADLITGKASALDISRFSPTRFANVTA
jgi:glycine oxidase